MAGRTPPLAPDPDPDPRFSEGRSLVQRIMEGLRSRLPGVSAAAIGGTLVTRLLATTMSFTAGVIVARELGVQGRAALALMVSVPAVLSILAVLGVDNANARFAGTSHTAFRQIVRWSVVFSLVSGSALAGLWLLLGRLWPVLLLGMPLRTALLASALCPVTLLTTLLGSAEIGRGRIKTYNIATAAPSVCYLAAVGGLLAAGSLTVTGCFLSALAGQLVLAAWLLVAATIRVHPDGEGVPARAFASFATKAYLPNLIHYGMLRLDVPAIQLLAGPTAVALYAVALPVAEGMFLLPSAVALVVFPRVTSGAVGAQAASRIARSVLAAAALVAVAAAATVPVLIPVVYGRSYAGAAPVIWAILPGLVVFSACSPLQAYLAGTDLLRPVVISTAVGAGVNIALLAVLTPRFGAIGAGVADSAGYLVFGALLGRSVRLKVRLSVRSRLRPSGHAAANQPPAATRRPPRRTSARPAGGRRPGAIAWPTSVLVHGSPLARAVMVTVAVVLAAVVAGFLGAAATPVAIAAGVAVIALICLLVPDAGLTVLAAVIPLSQAAGGPSWVTPNRLAALMLVCLLSRVVNGRGIARPKPIGAIVTIGAVGYLVAASAVIGGTVASGAASFQYLLPICAPLMLPLIVEAGPALERALLVFCSCSVVLAVIEIVQADSVLAAHADLAAADSAVLAISEPGTANHNAVGALFVMAGAVLLARYPAARTRLARLALGAGIVVLTAGVAYSLSRAAYLAGLAVLVIYVVRRSLRGVLALGLGTACLVPLLPAAIVARFGSAFGGGTLDADSAVRLDLWNSAVRMFDAHPVFGVGYLNFARQLPIYYHATGDYNIMFLQFPLLEFAHNTYLTVLSQAGLLGAAGIGSLVVLGFRRAWFALRSGDHAGEAALLAMVGAGVCSFFGEVLFLPALLAGMMLIILAARSTASAVVTR